MFWVLEGLRKSGRIENAVRLIEQQYGPLLDKGATTLWESWNSDQSYQSSLSHSWGGAPTWFLSTYLLGAQRTGPNRWQVQPAFAGVPWADGAIPLASGLVEVSWKDQPCQNQRLMVKAPPATSGEIRLSAALITEVQLAGQVIWSNGEPLAENVHNDGSEIVIVLPGGEYQLEMQIHC
jgi:alpha-L-rhamnosidase